MTLTQIEAFLAVMEFGSMTKAANRLYITQPTISHRIESLEEELGCPLLERRKGVRQIELTPQGKAFVPQARKWQTLLLETRHALSRGTAKGIFNVAFSQSFDYALSANIYRKFLSRNLPVHMFISSYNSEYLFESLERGLSDLVLMNFPFSSDNTTVTPFYREDMVIVAGPDCPYPDPVDVSALEIEKEIFINWGIDFKVWHEHNLGAVSDTYVHSGSLLNVEPMISHSDFWAVIPVSAARVMTQRGRARICRPSHPLPTRNAYLGLPVDYKKEYVDLFLEDVRSVLSDCEGMELL